MRKRPSDPMLLAKLIGDIATGQIEDKKEPKRISKSSKKKKRSIETKEK